MDTEKTFENKTKRYHYKRGVIMGLNDNINNNKDMVVVCPLCHEKYRQTQCEQADGRRNKEYDICPNCCSVNSSSVRVRFLNRRL